MGRYYNGDINGKFWFGVQNSDCADRFGVVGVQPETLYYYFDESDLQGVQDELKEIEKKLGDYLKQLNDFFAKNNGYNDTKLAKELGVSELKVSKILSDYADYELGKEIEKSIIEKGQCEFYAEM
jgi:NAD-specific glutamate dehydrogenase